MKQKQISLMTAVTMIMSLFGAMPLAARAAGTPPTIKLGDYVQMGNYMSSTLLWRCVAFEKVTGYDTNGNPIIDSTQTSQTYKDGYLPLMLADTAIGKNEVFDEPSNILSSSHGRADIRIECGSNYWGDSDIRSRLNSYGLLWKFTDTEKAAIQTVTQKSLLAYVDKEAISGASGGSVHTYNTSISNVVQNYSSAYSELITDTMFLLDVQQVYNVYNNLGDYYKLSSHYWLRSPYCSDNIRVRCIDGDGYVYDLGCTHPLGYNSSGNMVYETNVSGVRPAFFLNLSKASENPFVGLDGSGTKDEPYTFVHRHVLTYHAKVDATCTSSGTGEYWKCEGDEGCSKYFSDANGENEISSPPRIYSKGHTWSEWTITKEPTETENGEKERECSVCHTKDTKEIAAFNDLNIGDYLEMGEYDGTKLLWRCVAFEKATRRADGSIEIDSTDTQTKYTAVGKNAGDTGYLPLMLADAAIGKTKAFDANGEKTSGSHGRGSDRTKYGSNYWGDSNIRDWLNSADKTVAYTCGNAPEYNEEAGFLTNFNSAEKAAMISVKQKALINNCDWYAVEDKDRTGSSDHTIEPSITSVVKNYSNAYATHITDTMFLLDVQQLYNVYANNSYLGSNYYRLSSEYWLRSPYDETNYSGRYVSMSSSEVYFGSVYYRKSVRPAFFFDLPAVEFEGGDGKETPHTIHYHTLMHYGTVAATCTAAGTGEYWKCEGENGCNKMFSDANGETEIDDIPTINATGHNLTKTEAQAATCTESGNKAYWECMGCDKLFSDEAGTTKTTLADTVIAAKGHTWGEWEITKSATETEDGEKTRTCSVCGERETQVIPATGNEYDYSIKYENGKAVITAKQDGTYTVIFAAYDSGRLTSLSAQTVTVEKGETTVEPINFTAGGTVKVMLWDSLMGMKPLCAADGN